MIIAFCLYKYFPFGGLQRDFLRVAQTVAHRGYHVRVYVQSWQGERPSEFEIINVPIQSYTNHARNRQYFHWVQQHLKKQPVNCVVGFNKMPALDVYYAADVCYAEQVAQQKGFLYRLTGRYRHYAAFEQAVFEKGVKTLLLMLTNRQIADFKKHYQTEDERFIMLPSGIYPERHYSNQITDAYRLYRQKNGIKPEQKLLLQIGSDFSRKGVDRSIRAIAALPNEIRSQTVFFVVGQDKPQRFKMLAKQLGVHTNVHFFSGRDDVSQLMAAADLLLHPAYQEAAGIVLVEAIAAGLPLIVSEVCGYANHVVAADAGVVLQEPFEQQKFNQILSEVLQNEQKRQKWQTNARHYADQEDLYSLPEKAADIILSGKHA